MINKKIIIIISISIIIIIISIIVFIIISKKNYQIIPIGTLTPDVDFGQLNFNIITKPNINNIIDISAGYYCTLVLFKNGSIQQIGGTGKIDQPPTKLTDPSNSDFKAVKKISAGMLNAIALLNDNTIVVWGNNDYNQNIIPTLPTGAKWVEVSAGSDNLLALTDKGQVFGWGNNQAVDATGKTMGNKVIPDDDAVKKAIQSGIIAISAGSRHSLAVNKNGEVFGWGDNTYGQTTIPQNAKNIIAVQAGVFHSIALSSDNKGSVVVWGTPPSNNDFKQQTMPNGFDNSNIISISGNFYHNLVLKKNGTVVGWGRDIEKQATSTAMTGATNIKKISAGKYNSVLLKSI